MLPKRLQLRFNRLIGLLEGRSDILDDSQAAAADVAAMKQCEFTLATIPLPNLFIVGELVAYEGLKRAGQGGFDMTHSETGTNAVRALVDQFDRHFLESHREMARAHPPDGRFVEKLRACYDEAVSMHSD